MNTDRHNRINGQLQPSLSKVRAGRLTSAISVLLLACLMGMNLAGSRSGRALASSGGDSDTCLACHDDKTLTTKRGARTVSLFVDGKKFSGSVHGALGCTACHADLEGKDLPHSTPLAKVNCGS